MSPLRLAALLILAFAWRPFTESLRAAAFQGQTQGPVVLDRLSPRFSVRVEADSWDHLVERVQPTLSWNARDLLWITHDDNGRPRFTLDEAYIFDQKDRPRRWVLLDERPNPIPNESDADREADAQINRRKLTMTLSARVPIEHDGGAVDGGGYAVSKSTRADIGIVYELRWDGQMGDGTGHPLYSQLLYVLGEPSGRGISSARGRTAKGRHSGGNARAASDEC